VGYLGIYAGTKSEWVREVVDLITAELRYFMDGRLSEEDLNRAKNQVIGNMILGLESSDSWMSHLARNEIYFSKAFTLEEISEGIHSVSRKDVVDLACDIFQREGMSLTLLGDLEKISLDLRL
jgi:predicted Zn-dependent peptidase